MKGMPPNIGGSGMGGPGQESQGPRIDISRQPDVSCDNCGSLRFRPDTMFLKRLSSLVSPTGKEELVPLGPVFSCASCGHINDEALPPALRDGRQHPDFRPEERAPRQKDEETPSEIKKPNLTVLE